MRYETERQEGIDAGVSVLVGAEYEKIISHSEAILSKAHNDANVMALSEEMDKETMKDVVKAFIETPFSNVDRYVNRNNKIKDIEDNV